MIVQVVLALDDVVYVGAIVKEANRIFVEDQTWIDPQETLCCSGKHTAFRLTQAIWGVV